MKGPPQFLAMAGLTQAGDLGFEPKTLVFRWHSSRMAFTSQAIETPRIKGKPRFNYIIRMLQSHGQFCPQFAPNVRTRVRAGMMLRMVPKRPSRDLSARPELREPSRLASNRL
jgi:hypothetical protein